MITDVEALRVYTEAKLDQSVDSSADDQEDREGREDRSDRRALHAPVQQQRRHLVADEIDGLSDEQAEKARRVVQDRNPETAVTVQAIRLLLDSAKSVVHDRKIAALAADLWFAVRVLRLLAVNQTLEQVIADLYPAVCTDCGNAADHVGDGVHRGDELLDSGHILAGEQANDVNDGEIAPGKSRDDGQRFCEEVEHGRKRVERLLDVTQGGAQEVVHELADVQFDVVDPDLRRRPDAVLVAGGIAFAEIPDDVEIAADRREIRIVIDRRLNLEIDLGTTGEAGLH